MKKSTDVLIQRSTAVFEIDETNSKVKTEWMCTNVTALVGSKLYMDTWMEQT